MAANFTYQDIVKSYTPAKKHTSSGKINSVSFSMDGQHLVSCNDNDEIEVYNVQDGNSTRALYSKKYGCNKVHFTHHHTRIIYSRNIFKIINMGQNE